jgi:hypothetical protein
MEMGVGRAASTAPIIKCDLCQSVQCEMEFLLQLYPCALVVLAARSALCVENCELNDTDNRQRLDIKLHNYVLFIYSLMVCFMMAVSHTV